MSDSGSNYVQLRMGSGDVHDQGRAPTCASHAQASAIRGVLQWRKDNPHLSSRDHPNEVLPDDEHDTIQHKEHELNLFCKSQEGDIRFYDYHRFERNSEYGILRYGPPYSNIMYDLEEILERSKETGAHLTMSMLLNPEGMEYFRSRRHSEDVIYYPWDEGENQLFPFYNVDHDELPAPWIKVEDEFTEETKNDPPPPFFISRRGITRKTACRCRWERPSNLIGHRMVVSGWGKAKVPPQTRRRQQQQRQQTMQNLVNQIDALKNQKTVLINNVKRWRDHFIKYHRRNPTRGECPMTIRIVLKDLNGRGGVRYKLKIAEKELFYLNSVEAVKDDDFFIEIKNSWGTQWGHNGKIKMSIHYFSKYARMDGGIQEVDTSIRRFTREGHSEIDRLYPNGPQFAFNVFLPEEMQNTYERIIHENTTLARKCELWEVGKQAEINKVLLEHPYDIAGGRKIRKKTKRKRKKRKTKRKRKKRKTNRKRKKKKTKKFRNQRGCKR